MFIIKVQTFSLRLIHPTIQPFITKRRVFYQKNKILCVPINPNGFLIIVSGLKQLKSI